MVGGRLAREKYSDLSDANLKLEKAKKIYTLLEGVYRVCTLLKILKAVLTNEPSWKAGSWHVVLRIIHSSRLVTVTREFQPIFFLIKSISAPRGALYIEPHLEVYKVCGLN